MIRSGAATTTAAARAAPTTERRTGTSVTSAYGCTRVLHFAGSNGWFDGDQAAVEGDGLLGSVAVFPDRIQPAAEASECGRDRMGTWTWCDVIRR